ncbi:MAG: hypothetical protein JRG74_07095 [Deltaproteobacteria bacterium]|nr:hypothetical protein [Deltaproteobacteria bacterium]MBW1833884.1 hypothetical protein [Deltaproteobacteria bacterium]MBW2165856.1 hypothetical protein [Deltaproteobacteria bacterium]
MQPQNQEQGGVYVLPVMRIDAVIIALNQIKDKKYFEKCQGSGKEIYLFGVEFADTP